MSILRIAQGLLVVGLFVGLPAWLSSRNSGAANLAAPKSLPGHEAYRPVSWSLLGGFAYEDPMPGSLEGLTADQLVARNERIPRQVRALSGQKVLLQGYVIPAEMEDEEITSFLLSSTNDMGCCFGMGTQLSGWALVSLPRGQGFRGEPFSFVSVMGTLDVGEDVKYDSVFSLYRLRGDKVLPAQAQP
jgi:hypothetical protein